MHACMHADAGEQAAIGFVNQIFYVGVIINNVGNILLSKVYHVYGWIQPLYIAFS